MRGGGVVALVLFATSTVSADGDADYSFHAGASWWTSQANYNPTPSGFAPYLDAAIAWRFTYVSIGPFAALSSLGVQSWGSDQSIMITVDSRYNIFDLGLGIEFHGADHDGPFAGISIALQATRESGRKTVCGCTNPSCDSCPITFGNEQQAYTQWREEPLFLFRVGYTLPRIDNIPFEVVGAVGLGFNPDEPDYGPALYTARLALGARY